MNPERIKAHPPIEELSSESVAALDRYWSAVTALDPAGLLSVLAENDAHLHHFRSAMQSLVARYPDRRTGLGRWDHELLKRTREKGPRALRVIADAIGHNFDADLVGDYYLYARLLRLGDPERAHPLVTFTGDLANMRACEVKLTRTGEAVLDGRANAVELNGIDDWVLGVHLSSADGKVWYHQGGTLAP